MPTQTDPALLSNWHRRLFREYLVDPVHKFRILGAAHKHVERDPFAACIQDTSAGWISARPLMLDKPAALIINNEAPPFPLPTRADAAVQNVGRSRHCCLHALQ